jgi:hypothetical protein
MVWVERIVRERRQPPMVQKMQSITSPTDKMVRAGLNSDLWWFKDDLATGIKDQIAPLAIPNHPAHNLGCRKTNAKKRQINTGSLITFANQIETCTYDTTSEAGRFTIATKDKYNKPDSNSDIKYSNSEDKEEAAAAAVANPVVTELVKKNTSLIAATMRN